MGIRTIFSLVVVGSLVLLDAGCGSDAGNPPQCTGTSCTCPAGEVCDLAGSSCADTSCSLDCADSNECVGSCGDSCSIDCGGGSTCDVTVGASGSVTCSDGATCHIRCTGSCSVSCSGDSRCDLTCSGDDQPQSIPEGGSCG
jgi:hypothetical protein